MRDEMTAQLIARIKDIERQLHDLQRAESGSVNAANIATTISGATTDDTIADADLFGYVTGGTLVKTAWSNIKATLTTLFNALYVGLTGNQTVAGEKTFTNHIAVDGDSETSFNTVLGGASLSRWIASINRPIFALRKYRGTRASPVAVQSGDLLGDVGFQGYDGSNLQQGGMIHATVDGTPSAGSVPTRISITTGSSAASRAENLVVKSNGRVGFNGVTDPQGAQHAHDGVGGMLFVTKTGINGTTQTIIPNAAGDVLRHCIINCVLWATDGSHSQGFTRAIANNASSEVFPDAPTSANGVTLAVSAAGALTIQRTTGSKTYNFAGHIVWL